MLIESAMRCPECGGSGVVDSYRSNWGNLSAAEEFTHIGFDACESCQNGRCDIDIDEYGAAFNGDGRYAFDELDRKLAALWLDEGLIDFEAVAQVLQDALANGSWAGWSCRNGEEE